MLDDVERRRFLIKPAREDPGPELVAPLHVNLYEGAGQLLRFPGRCCLAGAQANDDVLPPRRLSRMKRDILDDAVALVEDSGDRDALRHWRNTLPRGGGSGLPCRRHRRALLLCALAARGERQRNQQRCGDLLHAYSGIQGS